MKFAILGMPIGLQCIDSVRKYIEPIVILDTTQFVDLFQDTTITEQLLDKQTRAGFPQLVWAVARKHFDKLCTYQECSDIKEVQNSQHSCLIRQL